MNESEIRRQLRDWILKRSKNPPKGAFTDTTAILDDGILSSLDVVEFVLYIESLRGDEVDTDAIEPEAFTSIDTLYTTFFGAA
jgi:acyl carrier protein